MRSAAIFGLVVTSSPQTKCIQTEVLLIDMFLRLKQTFTELVHKVRLTVYSRQMTLHAAVDYSVHFMSPCYLFGLDTMYMHTCIVWDLENNHGLSSLNFSVINITPFLNCFCSLSLKTWHARARVAMHLIY